MALLRKNEDEKAAKAVERESRDAQKAREQAIENAYDAKVATWRDVELPRWEYTTKYQREGRQKGFWGGGAMAAEFSRLGREGWELVGIYEERAVFKRQLLPPGVVRSLREQAVLELEGSAASQPAGTDARPPADPT